MMHTPDYKHLATARLDQLDLVLSLLKEIRAMETAVPNGTTRNIMAKIDDAMDVIDGMERKT